VVQSGVQFVILGQATAGTGQVRRVQVEIQDRNTKQYLQDDLVTWGGVNNVHASLATANASSTAWSLPVTITGNRELQLMAKTFTVAGASAATRRSRRSSRSASTTRPRRQASAGPAAACWPAPPSSPPAPPATTRVSTP
jgi:large repetitive protein